MYPYWYWWKYLHGKITCSGQYYVKGRGNVTLKQYTNPWNTIAVGNNHILHEQ